MKKLFFAFALFLLCSTVQSQWESVPLRLVTSTGTPNTGQAANITFRRSPFGGGDAISGLTVTETGTAGNYIVTGFTTFEKAKFFFGGVEQTWWGGTNGQYVGDLLTGLNLLYGRLGSSNTWTGATNQFQAGLFADVVTFEDIVTGMDYEMDNNSDLYLNISEPSNTTLLWKRKADSLYGIKGWYYDGTKLRLYSSGYKWYGRTSTTSPFEINTSHFSWSSDKLNLLPSAVSIDSIKHNNMTVGKDTSWIVLGETVSKWRFISIKKGFWYNAYSIPDWKWVYTSFDETGALLAMDSMMAINEATSIDNETNVSLQYDGTYTKVDSLLLPPGKYTIDFAIMWERPNHNDIAQMNVSDTVIVALKEASSAPNTYIATNIRHIETYADTTNFSGGVLQWSAVHTVYSTAKYVYVYGKYVANALSTALGLGPTASVKRGKIIATLIR